MTIPNNSSAKRITVQIPTSSGDAIEAWGSLFGRQPIYIPGDGRPEDLSIGATPDGPFGEKPMTPEDAMARPRRGTVAA